MEVMTYREVEVVGERKKIKIKREMMDIDEASFGRISLKQLIPTLNTPPRPPPPHPIVSRSLLSDSTLFVLFLTLYLIKLVEFRI